MRDLNDIVHDLNCDIWDNNELMSFYVTDSTMVQYIGIHYEGADIHLWCSEEESFETEDELKTYILDGMRNLIERLSVAVNNIRNIISDDKLIQVCDKCSKASCWYGEFMCEESWNAGTKLVTAGELKEMGLESGDYWSDKYMRNVYGDANPFGNEEE